MAYYNYTETGLPPAQINTNPYFTRETGDIMKAVMGYAQNKDNQLTGENEYWRGALPQAYAESNRNQYNTLAGAIGTSQQARIEAIKQQVQNYTDLIRQHPEMYEVYKPHLQALNDEFVGMKPQINSFQQLMQNYSPVQGGQPLMQQPLGNTNAQIMRGYMGY